MQEQPQYRLSPDHGWSQMINILDNAMPVENRTRRLVWLWWTAAAAVSTAAVIAVFVLMTKTNHVDQPVLVYENNKSINSAPHKEPGPSGIISSDIDGIEGKTIVTEESDPTSKLKVNHENNKKSITKSDPAKNHKSNMITTRDSDVIVDVIQNPAQNKGTTNNNVTAIEITEPVETAFDFHPAEARNMHESVAMLDPKPITLLPVVTHVDMNIDPQNAVTTIASSITKPLFTPHVAVGVLQGFNSGLGLNGGLGLDINLNSKLSLTTDIGYSMYIPEIKTLEFQEAQQVHPDNNGLLKNDLAGYEEYLAGDQLTHASTHAINPFIEALRQWQFTAGIKYDVTRKFFAQGGVTVGFGTSARSSYPIISVDYFAPVNNNVSVTNSFDSYNVIRNTMTSLNAGVGYKLSPKTEMYANVNYGLDHYITKESLTAESISDSDYIRGLNVGVRYKFQGP